MTKHYIRKDVFGNLYYYKDPEKTIRHREDGPAVEGTDGDKAWYQNGKLHREDGPAVECANGHKAWYQNDQLHRLDGPAIEYNGSKEYWYQCKYFPDIKTDERWKKHLKWMKFL